MEIVGIVVNAALVLGVGLVLGYFGKERFELLQAQLVELGGRLDALRTESREGDAQIRVELGSRLDTLRTESREGGAQVRDEMGQGFAQIRSEMAILRSDVTHIALAVGAGQRPDTG